MRIIATYNMKGGVGKTATSVNLAFLASRDGNRTLIWDLDPQGATSFYFRIKPKIKGDAKRLIRGKLNLDRLIKGTDYDSLDLLPSDFSYRNLDLNLDTLKKPEQRVKRLLKPVKSAYDLIFIDCPPAFSLVSESVITAADVLLIPLIPTTLSLRSLQQVRKQIKRIAPKKLHVLPMFTMVDRRKRLHKEICAAHENGEDGFLKSTIPFASAIERMGVERAPLITYAGRSRAATAYRALWNEVKAYL